MMTEIPHPKKIKFVCSKENPLTMDSLTTLGELPPIFNKCFDLEIIHEGLIKTGELCTGGCCNYVKCPNCDMEWLEDIDESR